jgi:hypothetical protein
VEAPGDPCHSGIAGQTRQRRIDGAGKADCEIWGAIIHGCDLAINHGVLNAQVVTDPLSQIFEVAECVSV